MSALDVLDLSNTLISGPLPDSMCEMRASIRLNILGDNNVTCYPSCLSAFQSFSRDESVAVCPMRAVEPDSQKKIFGSTSRITALQLSLIVVLGVLAPLAGFFLAMYWFVYRKEKKQNKGAPKDLQLTTFYVAPEVGDYLERTSQSYEQKRPSLSNSFGNDEKRLSFTDTNRRLSIGIEVGPPPLSLPHVLVAPIPPVLPLHQGHYAPEVLSPIHAERRGSNVLSPIHDERRESTRRDSKGYRLY
jgi:hypothetical protein